MQSLATYCKPPAGCKNLSNNNNNKLLLKTTIRAAQTCFVVVVVAVVAFCFGALRLLCVYSFFLSFLHLVVVLVLLLLVVVEITTFCARFLSFYSSSSCTKLCILLLSLSRSLYKTQLHTCYYSLQLLFTHTTLWTILLVGWLELFYLLVGWLELFYLFVGLLFGIDRYYETEKKRQNTKTTKRKLCVRPNLRTRKRLVSEDRNTKATLLRTTRRSV